MKPTGNSPATDGGQGRRAPALLRTLGPQNAGAVYVLVLISIIFCLRSPEQFARLDSVTLILNGSAITALAALAIIVPLAARLFDLSFAYTMSLSGVTAAHFVVGGHSLLVSALMGLLASLVVGVLNCVVVVGLKIDSFIGTLATGSLVLSFITFVTDGQTVNGPQLVGRFSLIYGQQLLGLGLPIYYAVGIAILLWVALEHTATGRRMHAIGFNAEAARLANVPVAKLRIGALLTCSLISGFAGIVIASSQSSGSTTAGNPYLLSAFATAFLGATQFKGGRFNSAGTLLAVVMLITGTTGLALSGAPPWAADMFTGLMLLAALGATSFQRRSLRVRRSVLARRRSLDPPAPDGRRHTEIDSVTV